jgi:hypothetical protein
MSMFGALLPLLLSADIRKKTPIQQKHEVNRKLWVSSKAKEKYDG